MALRFILTILIMTCWTTPAANSNIAQPEKKSFSVAVTQWQNAISAHPAQETLNHEDLIKKRIAERRQAKKEWQAIVLAQNRVIDVPDLEPMVHPLVWSGLNLALLAIVLAWASSEWEWFMLIQSVRRKSRLPEQETECTTG